MQKYYNLIVKMTKVGCLIPLEVTLTLKKKHDKYHPTTTCTSHLDTEHSMKLQGPVQAYML